MVYVNLVLEVKIPQKLKSICQYKAIFYFTSTSKWFKKKKLECLQLNCKKSLCLNYLVLCYSIPI